MNSQQTETLRLAETLEQQFPVGTAQHYLDGEAAAELRRLHSVNAQLLEALEFIPASGSMLGAQAEAKRIAAITAAKGEA